MVEVVAESNLFVKCDIVASRNSKLQFEQQWGLERLKLNVANLFYAPLCKSSISVNNKCVFVLICSKLQFRPQGSDQDGEHSNFVNLYILHCRQCPLEVTFLISESLCK